MYCYGSSNDCLWGRNDCATDADCSSQYSMSSPKFSGGDVSALLDGDVPSSQVQCHGWRAEACDSHAENATQPGREINTTCLFDRAFSKTICMPDPCIPTQVPHSDYATSGSMVGRTDECITVHCDAGYNGSGIATCLANNSFSRVVCTAIPCNSTEVPHSDKYVVGSIAGSTATLVSVTCDPGYSQYCHWVWPADGDDGHTTPYCAPDTESHGTQCCADGPVDGFAHSTCPQYTGPTKTDGTPDFRTTEGKLWRHRQRQAGRNDDGRFWSLNCSHTNQGCSIGNMSAVEAAILSPHSISWDNNEFGQLQHGGGNMYNGGNRISTSRCRERLAPYSDDMDLVPSTCFGPGSSSYRMEIRDAMMVLLSQNTGAESLTVRISGWLGTNDGGNRTSFSHTLGNLTGYTTSVCGATGLDGHRVPSINHLFVIDSSMSPGARHTSAVETHSDDDEISGIGPGSPIVYMLYASMACYAEEEHQAIFEAMVGTIQCQESSPAAAHRCNLTDYGHAKQLCESAGARLCTKAEVADGCISAGPCSHDDMVWTQDSQAVVRRSYVRGGPGPCEDDGGRHPSWGWASPSENETAAICDAEHTCLGYCRFPANDTYQIHCDTFTAGVQMDYEITISESSVVIDHSSDLQVLNSDFTIEVSTTPTNVTYPHSVVPLFFTQNPRHASELGLSIGHAASNESLQIRMGNGAQLAVHTFAYETILALNTSALWRVTCAMNEAGGRRCSVHVNGRQTTPAFADFAVTGSIYSSDGGLFGNVSGWRFIGTLHYVRIAGLSVGGPSVCNVTGQAESGAVIRGAGQSAAAASGRRRAQGPEPEPEPNSSGRSWSGSWDEESHSWDGETRSWDEGNSSWGEDTVATITADIAIAKTVEECMVKTMGFASPTICQPSGAFSNITCQAEPCIPAQVPHSDYATNDSMVGRTDEWINVTCDAGYNGSGIAMCLANNSFSRVVCTAIPCNSTEVPHSDKYGVGSIAGGTDDFVLVTCDPGYNTSRFVMCQANATFSAALCAPNACTTTTVANSNRSDGSITGVMDDGLDILCDDGFSGQLTHSRHDTAMCTEHASFMRVGGPCKCAGVTDTNQSGGADCASLYDSLPYCLVARGRCHDGQPSTEIPGFEWSTAACRDDLWVMPAQPVVCRKDCNPVAVLRSNQSRAGSINGSDGDVRFFACDEGYSSYSPIVSGTTNRTPASWVHLPAAFVASNDSRFVQIRSFASTSSSSIAHGGQSGRAFDGNTSGAFADSTCTHTEGGSLQWWQLDLGVSHQIAIVEIYHRTDPCTVVNHCPASHDPGKCEQDGTSDPDCCSPQSDASCKDNYTYTTGQNGCGSSFGYQDGVCCSPPQMCGRDQLLGAEVVVSSNSSFGSGHVCTTLQNAGGQPETIQCGVDGRFITVTVNTGNPMSICEVKIFSASFHKEHSMTCGDWHSGEFAPRYCRPDSCMPAELAHSDHSTSASIAGVTLERLFVECDDGYTGSGTAVCEPVGQWSWLVASDDADDGDDGDSNSLSGELLVDIEPLENFSNISSFSGVVNFSGAACIPNPCLHTEVAHSNYANNESIRGRTDETIIITCDAGHVPQSAAAASGRRRAQGPEPEPEPNSSGRSWSGSWDEESHSWDGETRSWDEGNSSWGEDTVATITADIAIAKTVEEARDPLFQASFIADYAVLLSIIADRVAIVGVRTAQRRLQAESPYSWNLTSSQHISGYDNEHLAGTVDECMQACFERSWCLSIDFHVHSDECDLSRETGTSIGGLSTNNGMYDNYEMTGNATRENLGG